MGQLFTFELIGYSVKYCMLTVHSSIVLTLSIEALFKRKQNSWALKQLLTGWSLLTSWVWG